jgi:hypothetical protein
MDGDFSFYSNIMEADRKFMIQILDAKVFLVSGDPMGQVSRGHLRLLGWLRSFTLVQEYKWYIRWDVKEKLGVRVEFDEVPSSMDGWWFCLPILQTLTRDDRPQIVGLILSSTGRPNEYHRAGFFTAEDSAYETFARPQYPIQNAKNAVTMLTNEMSHVSVHLTAGTADDNYQNIDYSQKLGTSFLTASDHEETIQNTWIEKVINII